MFATVIAWLARQVEPISDCALLTGFVPKHVLRIIQLSNANEHWLLRLRQRLLTDHRHISSVFCLLLLCGWLKHFLGQIVYKTPLVSWCSFEPEWVDFFFADNFEVQVFWDPISWRPFALLDQIESLLVNCGPFGRLKKFLPLVFPRYLMSLLLYLEGKKQKYVDRLLDKTYHNVEPKPHMQ
jgi:hypothetical protein